MGNSGVFATHVGDQGLKAERAVILAELIIAGKSFGPHLFWSRIARRTANGTLQHEEGVEVTSLPEKIALLGLDNAYIKFTNFEVSRSALLSRFASVSADGEHGASWVNGSVHWFPSSFTRGALPYLCSVPPSQGR